MTSIIRLDRFTLPAAARPALLARIAETHAFLREQPGFLRDAVMEGPDGGEIVTLVEWASPEAVAAARAAVADRQAETGFDRAAFLANSGITGHFSTLTRLDTEALVAQA